MIYSDRVARHRREVIEPEIIAEGTDSEEERVRRKKDDDESSEEEELEDEEIERRRNLLRQRALQRKEEEVTTIRFLCGPIMGSPHSLSRAYLQNYTSYGYETSWVDRSYRGGVQES